MKNYLKDQGGQFWGAFATSYANAVDKARDRPLKEAMMKAQIARENAITTKAQQDSAAALQQQAAVTDLANSLKGTTTSTPTEGPATEAGVGPAPVTSTTYPTEQELAPKYAAAAPGEFIKSRLEPKAPAHIPAGSMTPDPAHPGQWIQQGTPTSMIETPYQKETLAQRQTANENAAADRKAQRDISQGHLDVSKRLATVAEQNANTKATSKSKDLASMSDKDLELSYNRSLKTEQALEPGTLHKLNPFAGSDQDQRYAEASSDRKALQDEMNRRRGTRMSTDTGGRATQPTGKTKEERLKGLGF